MSAEKEELKWMINMKRKSPIFFAIATVITIASCGGSSKMSMEDAAGCKELKIILLETLRDMSSWIDQIPSTEYTRAGAEAGLGVANSMAGVSLKLKELSADTSSSKAKKVYDEGEETFRRAATAISLSGSVFEASDIALAQEANQSADKIVTFCDAE